MTGCNHCLCLPKAELTKNNTNFFGGQPYIVEKNICVIVVLGSYFVAFKFEGEKCVECSAVMSCWVSNFEVF